MCALPIERHHVVLAVRIEADVLHQHEIVVAAGLAECTVEHLHRALAVALIDFLVGANHALGRLEQTFTLRIVARIGDQRTHGGFRLLARGPRLNRRRRRSHVLGQALLRPRLHIGVLRVHDGSLRSTGRNGTGCVTGLAASATDPDRFRSIAGAWTPHSHRHSHIKPAQRREPFSRRRTSPYIFVCAAEANRRPGHIEKTSMLNDVYNSRILELAGNIPRLGRLACARRQRHRPFQAVRLDRHRRPQDGRAARSRDFAHDVKACALGQASSSIMARHVIGAKPANCASCAKPCARC